MPCFRVMVEGRGIEMPFYGAATPVVGFFATRQVSARTIEEAERKVVDTIASEWAPDGRFSGANRGRAPTLTVEDSWQVDWTTAWLKFRPRGYSFFLSADD
ncbi:MAG: hypothetical protein ACOY82_09115 [Pseudomonadota bacterium]